MSREDTIICMDNSEWMRNGDYSRSRFEAQYQAIEYLVRVKTTNPENTVGLISLAGGLGTGAQVLCSPTTERFKVGKAAQNAKIGGKCDIISGLKVAQLALKFRPQRSIQARIIMFVGSPVDSDDTEKLSKLAKQLKKNGIAVDVISVGEQDLNTEMLQKFIKDVEKRDGANSTLVVVPPGTYIEDAIKESSMSNDEENEEDLDPMLAMALAESRAMAEAQNNRNNNANSNESNTQVVRPKFDNTSTTATEGESVPAIQQMDEDEDEDAILEQAKLMSLLETNKSLPVDDNKTSGVGSALNPDYLKSMMKKAGVDVNSKEVEDELKDLQKTEKGDDDDDEKESKSKRKKKE